MLFNPKEIMFLDIETTGLPPRDAAWETEYHRFPYIVSIAYKIGDLVVDQIINQEGRDIPEAATRIHGVSNAQAKLSKKYLEDVINDLIKHATGVKHVVGHNIYFDTSIIKANTVRRFGRYSMHDTKVDKVLDYHKRIDLVHKGKKLTGGKWPKLIELHKILFGEGFDAHKALNDVLATERCFYELHKRGLII